MTPKQFESVSQELFYSKLLNSLKIFGNVWGLRTLDDTSRRFSAFTKNDNRRLQVLQNQILRLKTGLDRSTPTKDLLKATGDFSIQQLTGLHTLLTTHKIIHSQKPNYLFDQLKPRLPEHGVFPQRQLFTLKTCNTDLTISRGGFIYRAARLFNLLPVEIRKEKSKFIFKKKVKSWVLQYIPVKPP